MNELDKRIYKTILIIFLVVSVIMTLVFNRLMTPRFLSTIELKVNGYILLNADRDGSRKQSPSILSASEDNKKWFIVVDNEKEKKLITNLLSIVNDPMKSNTELMVSTPEIDSKLFKQVSNQDNFIAVINDTGKLSGYFKPPFDRNKMVVTYSSVFTHR
jgi:hypothetical protein